MTTLETLAAIWLVLATAAVVYVLALLSSPAKYQGLIVLLGGGAAVWLVTDPVTYLFASGVLLLLAAIVLAWDWCRFSFG